MLSLSLVVGPLVLLYLIYKYLVYPVFLSPLSKIPNAHFTSSFSPLWVLLKRYRDHENRAIHNAHVKHGDIVRLGPNEVSVACVDEGIRTIYSGGFEKGSWYPNQFDNFGVPCMFSMAASKPHSIRKRMISNVYSKSNLQSSPELHEISQVMIYERLLPLLEKAATESQPLDVLGLNYATTMDFIMGFLFGLKDGTNFIQDPETRRHWLDVYGSRRPYRFWSAELPGLVSFLEKLNIHTIPKRIQAATSEVELWTLSHCTAAQKSLTNPPPSQPPPHTTTTSPIVYTHLTTALGTSDLKPTSPAKPDLHLASELHDHLAAGHETSGIALTYLMHELSLRPSLQARLRTELRTLSPTFNASTKTLPSPRALDALPLLHALILETLRLHPPIPGPQPRMTPSHPTSLAHSPPLPPGTRVSAQAYTLHRNPAVFPNPESWNPMRWIEASEVEKQEMHRWWWAFGSGGRMCLGRHFAVGEMKLILAAVYARFETVVVDDAGIEQGDGYTVGPQSGKLILRFNQVDESEKEEL